ncbi:hypothetical protein [Paenibacillus crassostreae]|uniref:hypothetical protein n=1 Tax=Paenibacillus crassostreae TaxID=1763538 RepID=UPI000A7CB7FE|nr:hypothetical protein [Paenibacillus crassostreae]
MMEGFQFFCVFCEQLVSVDKATVIFKTGFYQYEISMGYCSECEVIGCKPSSDFQIIDN